MIYNHTIAPEAAAEPVSNPAMHPESLATMKAITGRALTALKPPPRMPLSEWIETEMRLPEGVSAQPGRVKLWPYQREIADAIGDPAIERVTIVKPVRVGFTTLLTGAVASFIANEPAPILCLLPTEADCRRYFVDDLEPTFAATPAVKNALSGERDEAGRDTILARRFPGGSLKAVAAKAPRNLRSHNVCVLFIDEADAMQTTPEGSPILLAERRTLSFPNRKIVIGSTPTTEETSHVLRAYAQSDQRVFEVPCPACGVFEEILWEHIEWEPDRPETAAYRCPHCRELIGEQHKAEVVAQGVWRATRPEVRGHAGFRLSALVSTLANASWAKLAAEFLVAKDRPDALQTFVNTILAQPWREAMDEGDPDSLRARAEPFGLDRIPAETLLITAGVDVQADRLEVTTLGHSRDAALVLAHEVIWGGPGDNATWAELDDLLRRTWQHPNGGTLRVDAALVDSGDGAWTQRVYDFCRPRQSRRIYAAKGVAGVRPPIAASQSSRVAPGVRLMVVGVDGLKRQLFQRLARGQTVRFSDSLEEEWFRQLTSEHLVTRYVRGAPVLRFERIPGRRAEALDCTIYALAARFAINIALDQREADLKAVTAPAKAPSIIRSRWLTGG